MGFKLNNKQVRIPYFIGLAWFISHPIVSVITGELKCRGMYVDEHQLDIPSLQTEPYELDRIRRNYLLEDTTSSSESDEKFSNACDVLEYMKVNYSRFQRDFRKKVYEKKQNNIPKGVEINEKDDEERHEINPYQTPYISCNSVLHQVSDDDDVPSTNNDYSVIRIDPSQSPLQAVEALVIVLPFTTHWLKSDFHSSMLTFIEHMVESPWMAKSILIVSPNEKYSNVNNVYTSASGMDSHLVNEYTSNMMVDPDVVKQFINDFYSIPSVPNQFSLPIDTKSLIVRQLIAIEIDASPRYSGDKFFVLPQGRNGLVPNLDLLSAVRLALLKVFGGKIQILMHLHDLTWWDDFVKMRLPADKFHQNWAKDFGNMIGFMAAFWSPSPHSFALENGIDSFTLRAHLRPNRNSESVHASVVHTVSSIENLVRGLNSLSEKLHHNVNQYVMPSAHTFVSHSEYILPAILLILPLALRVIKTLLQKEVKVNFRKCWIFGASAIAMSYIFCYIQRYSMYTSTTQATFALLSYFLAFGVAALAKGSDGLQVVACMLGLYFHLPIAMTHISLFLLSAFIWVPFLAFVEYDCMKSTLRNFIFRALVGSFLFAALVLGLMTTDLMNDAWGSYVFTIGVPMQFLVVGLMIL